MQALDVLLRGNGAELWPRLIKYLDDDRYVFTCEINGAVSNLTIWHRWLIAYYDLVEPFGHVWPNQSEIPNVISAGGQTFFPPPHRDLKGWYRARQRKPLWQLQVELGEWELRQLRV